MKFDKEMQQIKVSNKEIVYVSAPSNLGLKQMEYADKDGPGVRKMPAIFEEFKFKEHLNIVESHQIIPPKYTGKVDLKTGIRNLPQLIDYSQELAQVIKQIVAKDKFPIVIGGDCSILVGSMLALRQLGTYGVVHIDGHTDYAIARISSSTGGVGGMNLAIVTGIGDNSLTNIDNLKPYVQESNAAQFGNRCDDKTFNGNFYNTNIFNADLPQLRVDGIEATVNKFLDRLNKTQIDGIWLHIDADVLNTDVMSAVDSPQEDGLSYPELKTILKLLLQSGYATGIQFTIYDPDLDPDKSMGKQFVTELVDLFKSLS